MRSPPMTSGYSRPISDCTFCRAASIAALFSGLLKSVKGSFLNSVSIRLRSSGKAVGMYSKSKAIATGLIALLCAACGSVLPWHDEPVGDEVNIAFTIENNLLFLTMARIENHPGRFFFGSADPRSVLDPKFAAALGPRRAYAFDVGQKQEIRVVPVMLTLGGAGDAIIGADVFGNHAVSIDYRVGLITFQREGIHPEGMQLFRFSGDPSITIDVDGKTVPAIVDTALPDTLVLPRAKVGCATVHVNIAGTDFGPIDSGYANIPAARIGNRLLSRFL